MGEEEHDRLVVDVADALTLNQDVDWERCAREAAPASRRTLANLRLVADLHAGFRVQGEEAAGETAMGSRLPGSVVVRLAVRALIAFAALWVAALVSLGLWGWNDFRREYGELASYLRSWRPRPWRTRACSCSRGAATTERGCWACTSS